MELAIKRHLPVVVDNLCQCGANMNTVNGDGDCPLWLALESGQEDIASTLVRRVGWGGEGVGRRRRGGGERRDEAVGCGWGWRVGKRTQRPHR